MNKQIDTKTALITLAKLYAAADFIWALTVATFVGSLLSSGVNLAGCDIPTLQGTGTVSVFTGSLLAFIIASFQGGIFLVVFSFAAFIMGTVFTSLFKIDWKAVWHYGRWGILAAAVYALIAATFLNSIVSLSFGLMSGFAGCISAVSLGFFGSIAGWILAFLLTFLQACIFMIVGSMALFIITVVCVSLFGNKNSSAK